MEHIINACLRVSLGGKRHQDHATLTRKHSIGWLTIQRFSPFITMVERKHGAGERAENSTPGWACSKEERESATMLGLSI